MITVLGAAIFFSIMLYLALPLLVVLWDPGKGQYIHLVHTINASNCTGS